MQLVKEQILVESEKVDSTVRIDTLHPMDVCDIATGLYHMVLNDVGGDGCVRCWDFDMKAVVMMRGSVHVRQVPAKVVVTE